LKLSNSYNDQAFFKVKHKLEKDGTVSKQLIDSLNEHETSSTTFPQFKIHLFEEAQDTQGRKASINEVMF
jgi:hypothetical protein